MGFFFFFLCTSIHLLYWKSRTVLENGCSELICINFLKTVLYITYCINIKREGHSPPHFLGMAHYIVSNLHVPLKKEEDDFELNTKEKYNHVQL